MKNKKYIICSGLAFADKEDMEKLHQYALQGWVFRKMCFLFYVLYREEPQDVIFDYDMQRIKKKEKDIYLQLFEDSDWKLVSKWNKDLRFFTAPYGSAPLHTEKATRNHQYKTGVISAISMLMFGIVLFTLTLLYKWGVVVSGIAGGFIGIGFMGSIACFLRTKGEYWKLNVKGMSYCMFEVILGIAILIVCILISINKGFQLTFLFVLVVNAYLIGHGIIGLHRIYIKNRKRELI